MSAPTRENVGAWYASQMPAGSPPVVVEMVAAAAQIQADDDGQWGPDDAAAALVVARKFAAAGRIQRGNVGAAARIVAGHLARISGMPAQTTDVPAEVAGADPSVVSAYRTAPKNDRPKAVRIALGLAAESAGRRAIKSLGRQTVITDEDGVESIVTVESPAQRAEREQGEREFLALPGNAAAKAWADAAIAAARGPYQAIVDAWKAAYRPWRTQLRKGSSSTRK